MGYVNPNLARNYDFAVSSDGVTYTTVSGVQTLAPKINTDTTDITTFDTNGIKVDGFPTMFAGELSFELVESYDTNTTPYVQDVGQVLIMTKASNLGLSSRIYWRITSKTPTLYSGALTGTGFTSVEETGGGSDGVDMIKGKIAYDSRPTGTGVFAKKMGSQ